MSNGTKMTIATTILASSFFLSGCNLLSGAEKTSMDPPPQKEVTLVDDEGTLKEETGAETKKTETGDVASTVKTELYLIDKGGYVVPQTLELPASEGVAKRALEYLVDGGPVSNVLPSGFRAVIPTDTQVSVDIKDGVATADFSKEFKNYQKEDELKILQAITWTLTQFDAVKTVKLSINGEKLDEMPVAGTPIQEKLSRTTGINIDLSDVTDLSNSKALTVYYIGGEAGAYYYVPVTKRVSENQADDLAAIVNELVKGPSYSSTLISGFMGDVALLDEPELVDGKVTLNFNENILGSTKEKKVSKEVLDALVLSLTEQEGVKSVEVQVDGSGDLVNEEGKSLSEPVSRPDKVNTGSY